MASAGRAASVPLLTGVVIVQGIHVVEHIIQLIQVFVLGVPDDQALGLLGYVFQFQGTEEWLHLGFNAAYVAALYLLVRPLRARVPRPVPVWAFTVFLLGAVGLESWHLVEHVVIISHVLANNGCPCPGIGDVALGTTDTLLHFGYNALTYEALLVPYVCLRRARPAVSAAAA
jgi:hypothetical protein